jgi:hypothetical protein
MGVLQPQADEVHITVLVACIVPSPFRVLVVPVASASSSLRSSSPSSHVHRPRPRVVAFVVPAFVLVAPVSCPCPRRWPRNPWSSSLSASFPVLVASSYRVVVLVSCSSSRPVSSRRRCSVPHVWLEFGGLRPRPIYRVSSVESDMRHLPDNPSPP